MRTITEEASGRLLQVDAALHVDATYDEQSDTG